MSPDNNLTDDQRWLLNAAHARFRDSGEWPRVDELQHALDRAEEDHDVDSIAESLDRRYGWRSRGQDEYVELTLCGVAACEGAEDDLADVLTVGRKAFSLYLVHGAGFSLSSSDVAPDLDEDGVRLRKVLILGQWLPGWGGGSSSADAWTRIITRDIRRWRDVTTVDAMLSLAPCTSEGLHADAQPEQTPAASTGVAFSGEPTGRGTFSLRQHGPPAKTSELLTPAAWGGIVALVRIWSSFQRFAEAVYLALGSDLEKPRRNAFQNLDESNRFWLAAIGRSYPDMLTDGEHRDLVRLVQQRHVLAHQDGAVDQDYLDKSGDRRYKLGQRLVIKPPAVLRLADIVAKLSVALRSKESRTDPP